MKFNSKRTAATVNQASSFNKHGVPTNVTYNDVPKLMVGFDTETTGLRGRPVSYGLVVYRNKIEQPNERESFLVDTKTPMEGGAYNVHHISPTQLRASSHGMRTRVGEESFDPALTDTSGYHRMIQKLGDLQKQGAVFVGHNLGFDWDAIENTHRSLYGDLPMADFDIKAARANTRDTLEHARTIGDTHFDPEKGRDSQTLENLCRKHGIPAGNHAALGDADASVKLYLKQIGLTNRVPKTATRANTVGEISGIDYSKISPWCGKDKGICSGCREIESRKAENIDKDGKVIDKQRHKIIKNLEKLHKG